MINRIFILIAMLSTIRSIKSDAEEEIKVIRYTMPLWMRLRATHLIQNGFINQMDLSKIAANLTSDFNTNYGSEWFCIIGPIGYVAHFNYDRNTLLWISINEIEIILYKPMQADDLSVIKSARIGQYKSHYIHSAVRTDIENTIKGLARNASLRLSSYEQIQSKLREDLESRLGGSWLIIVTSAAPNYDSDWDTHFDIDMAMEFDWGSLRFFVYQKKDD